MTDHFSILCGHGLASWGSCVAKLGSSKVCMYEVIPLACSLQNISINKLYINRRSRNEYIQKNTQTINYMTLRYRNRMNYQTLAKKVYQINNMRSDVNRQTWIGRRKTISVYMSMLWYKSIYPWYTTTITRYAPHKYYGCCYHEHKYNCCKVIIPIFLHWLFIIHSFGSIYILIKCQQTAAASVVLTANKTLTITPTLLHKRM